jgi:hypothetical protein
VAYEVPVGFVTGDEAINGVNRELAAIYTEIAIYRKEIYNVKVKGVPKDMVSIVRSMRPTRKLIAELKVSAAESPSAARTFSSAISCGSVLLTLQCLPCLLVLL